VTLAVEDARVALTVRDDGGGLPVGADPARWEREGHMGLVGMRERIAALGGAVALAGVTGGAELRVWVPRAPALDPEPDVAREPAPASDRTGGDRPARVVPAAAGR
jgi:signal transduction histidine kinase